MVQEITYKLMARLNKKRSEMANSVDEICPRIKKRLDKCVTESRDWNATWDGQSKYLVKSGCRAVTVDLINNMQGISVDRDPLLACCCCNT